MFGMYTVSFFGHRYVEDITQTEEQLEKLIIELMENHKFVEFLVGRDGEFDQVVSSTIRRCKKKAYDDNSLFVLVLPYAKAEYLNNKESFEKYYDEIEVCHASEIAHPKSAFKIRNEDMIDRSDLVVLGVSENVGGAYKALQYAKKNMKKIINLYEKSD